MGAVSLPNNRKVNIRVSLVISLKIGSVSAMAPKRAIPVPNRSPNEILEGSNESFVKVVSLESRRYPARNDKFIKRVCVANVHPTAALSILTGV